MNDFDIALEHPSFGLIRGHGDKFVPLSPLSFVCDLIPPLGFERLVDEERAFVGFVQHRFDVDVSAALVSRALSRSITRRASDLTVDAKRFRPLSYGHPVLHRRDNTGPLCIHDFGARPYRNTVAYLIASLKRLSGLSVEATRLLKMHLEAGPLLWRIVGPRKSARGVALWMWSS